MPTFVLFQRFVSHVNMLKQNNFTETKHCFAFVLCQFYFSYNHCFRVLGMIKRTIRFKDTMVMLSRYKTLVRPHVEYCIIAWNPHYKKIRS